MIFQSALERTEAYIEKISEFEKYMDGVNQKHLAMEYIVHDLDELKQLNTKFQVM